MNAKITNQAEKRLQKDYDAAFKMLFKTGLGVSIIPTSELANGYYSLTTEGPTPFLHENYYDKLETFSRRIWDAVFPDQTIIDQKVNARWEVICVEFDEDGIMVDINLIPFNKEILKSLQLAALDYVVENKKKLSESIEAVTKHANSVLKTLDLLPIELRQEAAKKLFTKKDAKRLKSIYDLFTTERSKLQPPMLKTHGKLTTLDND